MKEKTFKFFVAVAAMALGAAIYIVFRSGTYIHAVAPPDLSGALADIVFPLDGFVRYLLCDLLWALALCSSLSVLLTDRAAAAVTLCFGCGWELAQAAGVIAGTGDPLDCLMYLFGAIIAVLINKHHKRKR